LRRHKRELSILEMPADYLNAPVALLSQMPYFSSTEEYEAFNAEFCTDGDGAGDASHQAEELLPEMDAADAGGAKP
jgi:hypothetical protein